MNIVSSYSTDELVRRKKVTAGSREPHECNNMSLQTQGASLPVCYTIPTSFVLAEYEASDSLSKKGNGGSVYSQWRKLGQRPILEVYQLILQANNHILNSSLSRVYWGGLLNPRSY